MLVALRSDRTTRVVAWEANKGNYHYCPDCNEELILKQGEKVINHFAHFSGSDCALSSKGEGERHEQMKIQMGQMFEKLGENVTIDYEVRFPTIQRRADVVVKTPDLKFVIECQVSPILVPEWRERTSAYNQVGYPVLWVWDGKRIGNIGTGNYEWRNFETSIPYEIKYCWKYSSGGVYILSESETLKACHFYFRTETLADKVYIEPPISFRSFKSEELGLLLGELGEGKFWKESKESDSEYLRQTEPARLKLQEEVRKRWEKFFPID